MLFGAAPVGAGTVPGQADEEGAVVAVVSRPELLGLSHHHLVMIIA